MRYLERNSRLFEASHEELETVKGNSRETQDILRELKKNSRQLKTTQEDLETIQDN